jgi:hypothetical protein
MRIFSEKSNEKNLLVLLLTLGVTIGFAVLFSSVNDETPSLRYGF